mmetsp:Transcript_4432/g.6277  ORF Transcript_4432/g.6277 Transcript_4432/m.6277 type:complete len:240 (-) Transcript_4432:1848-2567(-)
MPPQNLLDTPIDVVGLMGTHTEMLPGLIHIPTGPSMSEHIDTRMSIFDQHLTPKPEFVADETSVGWISVSLSSGVHTLQSRNSPQTTLSRGTDSPDPILPVIDDIVLNSSVISQRIMGHFCSIETLGSLDECHRGPSVLLLFPIQFKEVGHSPLEKFRLKLMPAIIHHHDGAVSNQGRHVWVIKGKYSGIHVPSFGRNFRRTAISSCVIDESRQSHIGVERLDISRFNVNVADIHRLEH